VNLNFTDWNLSSTEKKIFHFFTNNATNLQQYGTKEEETRYWFVTEVKPSSNTIRISRHFNYEDVFIEDNVPDFISDSGGNNDILRSKYKFVFKDSSINDDLESQSFGRVRSFQATDIFNDKGLSSLDSFINKSKEDLLVDLEIQLQSDTTDPYLYMDLDTSNPHIYFYMPPDWLSLHMSYKIMDEDLFNTEKATTTQWSSTTWTSSLFQEYVDAISRRLMILREALVENVHSSIFSYNSASRIGLYSFRSNFYGDSSDIKVIGTTDYLMQQAYEIAASDYGLLEYADYMQIELFPRWGSLDSYTDEDLNDFIDMQLEYGQNVVSKDAGSICKIFPIITHKVINTSSNSNLMVLSKEELIKFINRIDYHIDNINYSFWEYGIYNESDYDNLYKTPSNSSLTSGLGYSGGYLDSYPWTSDPLDPNGLQIDESLQPYLHGREKENTTLWCYFTNLFEDTDC
jgi:hypothetical protein